VAYHHYLDLLKGTKGRGEIRFTSISMAANTNQIIEQIHDISLEIVLGQSPLRIAIVVLQPFLLILAIGLWFQSRNPTNLATVQTVWGIASYIVTAGSCESTTSTRIRHDCCYIQWSLRYLLF
jgi:hypothetical protein